MKIPKAVVLQAVKQSAAMTDIIQSARKAIAPFRQLSPRICHNTGYETPEKYEETVQLLRDAYCILVEVQAAVSPREVEV